MFSDPPIPNFDKHVNLAQVDPSFDENAYLKNLAEESGEKLSLVSNYFIGSQEEHFYNELRFRTYYECGICEEILIDPHYSECCEQNLCGKCCKKIKTNTCPFCRAANFKEGLVKFGKKMSRSLNSLKFKCPKCEVELCT